jgi:peptidoglycan hydrolase CwlO-like protein
MNNSGKTITIFLGLIVVLLVSTASISIFLLNKETEKRKAVEAALNDAQGSVSRLQGDLKVAQNKAFVLEEKNKEADARVNSLEEELDVEKGLKEAMKTENSKLKQDLDAATAERDKVQADLDQKVQELQAKTQSAQQDIQSRDARVKELETKVSEAENKLAEANAAVEKAKAAQAAAAAAPAPAPAPAASAATDDANLNIEIPPTVSDNNVELDKIIVNKTDSVKGRVLSVDKETEFIIFDMGAKSGVKQGDVMSVMRGDEYLGDIKISRVQDEMSAADLIPPFSSRMVRKNDTVVPKK